MSEIHIVINNESQNMILQELLGEIRRLTKSLKTEKKEKSNSLIEALKSRTQIVPYVS